MSDDSSKREQIRQAIQKSRLDEIEGVVTGWVTVAEYMDVDGQIWLSRLDGDAGDETLPNWRREGFLHNALHTSWEQQEDD